MKTSQTFDASWKRGATGETSYLHWTRGHPRTQIQLAFRNHWILFQELIATSTLQGRRCIELGCGRGTISMYFADAGWDCTLVDISPSVLETAKSAFEKNGLRATFMAGDALATRLDDDQFDVCVSIGLLEHLPDLRAALAEQLRILRKGGLMLAYVVPEKNPTVQEEFDWVNDILALYMNRVREEAIKPQVKPDVYRSDAGIREYRELLAGLPIRDVQASGVYSLPMVSPSTSFPFTLNPPEVEERLVQHFEKLLEKRAEETGKNPWLCDEDYGHAFLVWGWKDA